MTIPAEYIHFFMEEFYRNVNRFGHNDLMSKCFDYADKECPEGHEAIRAYYDVAELSTVPTSRGPLTSQWRLGKDILDGILALAPIRESVDRRDRIYHRSEILRRLKEISRELSDIVSEIAGYLNQ